MANTIYNEARFGRGQEGEAPTIEEVRSSQETLELMVERQLENTEKYYKALENRRNQVVVALKMLEEGSSFIIGTMNKETYEGELLNIEREIRRVSLRYSKLKGFNVLSCDEYAHHNLM